MSVGTLRLFGSVSVCASVATLVRRLVPAVVSFPAEGIRDDVGLGRRLVSPNLSTPNPDGPRVTSTRHRDTETWAVSGVDAWSCE